MDRSRRLRIYLDEAPLARAEAGDFNVINRIRTAFEGQGFAVDLVLNTPAARMASAARAGYTLFMMDDPFHPRALTLRRAYYYPFWRIEASAKRWEWEIVRTPFDSGEIDPDKADKWCRHWRRKHYGRPEKRTSRDGFVYVPLQGRLTEHRSFQTMSPLSMLKALLDTDRDRRIVATLHPGESYTPQELRALDDLQAVNPRLEVSTAPMADLIGACDYVATENSSVALAGFFFRKSAVLFADIDFHHIAARVSDGGVEAAIRSAHDMQPDYDRYLYWFLKLTTISAGAEDAEDQILAMVRRRGWDV